MPDDVVSCQRLARLFPNGTSQTVEEAIRTQICRQLWYSVFRVSRVGGGVFPAELLFSRLGTGLETDQERVLKVLVVEHLILVLVFACTGLGFGVGVAGLGCKTRP